ncbi:7c106467-9840-4d81-bfd2-56a0d476e373 [Thermothielavioides terrestris]|uniref:7c106467-9840-4d81-bfd2-56a0d476e373 n=1 Tax=Thermothielavioides terrestris TaxID=2587410 RepID=A0A3S4DA77_9PEZI|nr:7c106467-9840-4d81-bfd2-56a0d476e373 [Thermothielavioides terrestris]
MGTAPELGAGSPPVLVLVPVPVSVTAPAATGGFVAVAVAVPDAVSFDEADMGKSTVSLRRQRQPWLWASPM